VVTVGNALMQIGEVAERTGLSLRTIRYYEEVGLVVPSARSQGGFRLYTNADIDRLQTVRRMKPLDFPLEQMRELLEIIERLTAGDRPAGAEQDRLLDTMRVHQATIRTRCEVLRSQLATAQDFESLLTSHIDALE